MVGQFSSVQFSGQSPEYFFFCARSVLAEIAFPLHASEVSDKSETGREKNVSFPAESSHFFPFKKILYLRGPKVTFFGKDVKGYAEFFFKTYMMGWLVGFFSKTKFFL